MKIPIFLLYIIASYLSVSVPSFADDKIIGYVESLSGVWEDHHDPKRVLSPHSPIRSDSEIKAKTSRADYFITIRIYGLATSMRHRCSKPLVCASTLDLQEALHERDQKTLSTFQRVIGAFKSIFLAPPRVWIRPIERAGSDRGVQDDVVIVDADGMTVDKLFSGLAHGRYEVAYKKIGSDLPWVKVNIEWSGNWRLQLALEPGMYELQVKQIDTTDATQSPEWSCVILVVSRDKYNSVASLMQEGRDYLATFEDSTSQEAKTLLRYLMLAIDDRRVR